MTVAVDPRPLVGEPLPLDLVNTRWVEDGRMLDLLEMPGGLATWLSSVGLADEAAGARDDDVLGALRATREAVLAVLRPEEVDAARARTMLNETLAHGHVRRLLAEEGPVGLVETDGPAWTVAWRAADELLRLLEQKPDRIRKCANHACVLRFYDVSKAGSRRWCSMTSCGNRAKARTHYARRHASG